MYRGKFGSMVAWQSAKVDSVFVDGDSAKVVVTIAYEAIGAAGELMKNSRPVNEVWVRVGGDWWYRVE